MAHPIPSRTGPTTTTISAVSPDSLVDEPEPHAPNTFATIARNLAAYTSVGLGVGVGAALLPLGGAFELALPMGALLGGVIGAVLGALHGLTIAGIQQGAYQAALGRARARAAAQAALEARVVVMTRTQGAAPRIVSAAGHRRPHTHTKAS